MPKLYLRNELSCLIFSQNILIGAVQRFSSIFSGRSDSSVDKKEASSNNKPSSLSATRSESTTQLSQMETTIRSTSNLGWKQTMSLHEVKEKSN